MAGECDFNETEIPYVNKAEQYCAASEQCCATVREKLAAWGAERGLAERIVEHLEAEGYIDEARYCRIYSESKLHLQKWGRKKIAYQLRLKRIDTSLIAEALEQLDRRQYEDTLRQLAESKNRAMKEGDPRKRRAKLTAFLASHGFESDEIHNVINQLTEIS